MNIVLTGSLGNINRPLVDHLAAQRHSVTVISRKHEKKWNIEVLGAKLAVGNLDDSDFLSAAFSGADAVYLMEPSVDFFDHTLDIPTYYGKLGENFVKAVKDNEIKHVVHLSSIGAHMATGNGILVFHHVVESILRELPNNVSIVHIRPMAFYNNLTAFIPAIKKNGIIASNYGDGDLIPWASPVDIAAAVADELAARGHGRKIRYVVSEELTCRETAKILGNAIGKEDLKWTIVPDQLVLSQFESIGMAPHLAAGLVEMNAAMHSGKLFEDYYRNKPGDLGKIKMKDFVYEFSKKYHA